MKKNPIPATFQEVLRLRRDGEVQFKKLQKFQKREMKHHFVMGEIQFKKFQKLNPKNFKTES